MTLVAMISLTPPPPPPPPPQEQKQQAYDRIMLGTLAVAMIGLAFAVGIGCTERPPKPKNRPE